MSDCRPQVAGLLQQERFLYPQVRRSKRIGWVELNPPYDTYLWRAATTLVAHRPPLTPHQKHQLP